MKAIAVIDIPDVSNIEDMFLVGEVHISYKTNNILGGLVQRLDKTQIKQFLPYKYNLSKHPVDSISSINEWYAYDCGYVHGWNDFIDTFSNDFIKESKKC